MKDTDYKHFTLKNAFFIALAILVGHEVGNTYEYGIALKLSYISPPPPQHSLD